MNAFIKKVLIGSLLCIFSAQAQIDTTNVVSGFSYIDYSPLSASAAKLAATDSLQDAVTGDYYWLTGTTAAAVDTFVASAQAIALKGYDTRQLFTDKAASVFRLDLPSTVTSDGSLTIVSMFYKDSLKATENQVLVSLSNGTATPVYWILIANADNKLRLAYRPAGVTSYTSKTVIQKNTWYHIVAVFDFPNTLAKLYVNGELDSTYAMPSKAAAAPDRWYLNNFDLNRTLELFGYCRAVFIYSDAKSAAWVATEYAKLDSNLELLPVVDVKQSWRESRKHGIQKQFKNFIER